MKPKTNDPTSPTISIEEAADLLRCGVEAVRKIIDTGELPALQLNQRHTVLLRDDVIDFVRSKAREQAKVRKVEHARRNAPRPPAPVPPAKPGEVRRRRPLPDLDKYEALPTPCTLPKQRRGRKRRPLPDLDALERLFPLRPEQT